MRGASLAAAALLLGLAGCGGSPHAAAEEAAEEAAEARERRHAVAVRTKPLWLDAVYEGKGRTSVSWIGPIYPPAPRRDPGPQGSGVAAYRYRYRLGASRSSVAGTTRNPGFVLEHTREGEHLRLRVQPVDDSGARRQAAHARLTISRSKLTPDNPGKSEPGEYGKVEMYPEPEH
jgi:hypothetical protein